MLLQKMGYFFELSSEFATDQNFSLFRNGSTALNVLSAVLVGLLLRNGIVALGGLIFSLLAFWLCVLALDKRLALIFGVLVAFYWGAVGWISGNALALTLHSGLSLPIVTGLLFFTVSLGLHNWYVQRKSW